MKKILFLFCIITFIISCNKSSENEYVISGTINGVEDGKMVFLERQGESGLISIDTVKIEAGKFKFKGTTTNPEFHMVQVESIKGKVPFILEKGKINLAIFKDSVSASKISGTYNNEQLIEFNVAGNKIQKKMADFQKENESKMQIAQSKNDTATINDLRNQFLAFQTELQTMAENYMKEHPDSYITVLLIQGSLSQPNADIKKIKKTFDSLSSDLKNTNEGKEIKEMLEQLSTIQIGSVAPDFSAPNPEGKMISLKESLGKITIIDFWASWCSPCRDENPKLVALYNEFHSKGLNIIGVSLDKEGSQEKWKEAIAKDKLTWTQVSNLKFWKDPIAADYNIKGIPQTYVVDANCVIVAKDLRGDALKAKVKELLEIK